MIGWMKRFVAAILAILMLALTACSGNTVKDPGNDSSGETNGAQVAMGRYIEGEYALPEGIGYVKSFVRMPDGSLELFCNMDPDKMMGPWVIFQSVDGGQRWIKKDAPFMEQFGELTSVSAAAYDPQGGMYIYYNVIPQEIYDAVLAQDYEKLEGYVEKDILLYVSPEGETKQLDIELPSDQSGAGVNDIRIADNGDLILDCYFSIIQADPTDGSVKNTYAADYYSQSMSFATAGNTLYVSDGDEIVSYDLTTGEKTDSFSSDSSKSEKGTKIFSEGSRSGRRKLAVNDEKTALFFADNSGLYRKLFDGATIEKLVEGELTSLNMPSMGLNELVVLDESNFLVLFSSDDGYSLLHYSYSADTPTVPTTELRVFSLYENKTIRQAMGLYQRANPDVHVVYDVALADESAVTVSDAMRTLSNELLAGKGPDLIVLDGMPIDAYIEKGALLDLAPVISEKTASGEWLKNASESFLREDGKIYALPARFSVPVMVADNDAEAVTDLASLVDYLLSKKPGLQNPDDDVLTELYPAMLLSYFYEVCSPVWFNEDGTLKEDVFKAYLSEIKRLYDSSSTDLSDGYEEGNIYYGADGFDPTWGSLNWLYDHAVAAVGNLNSIKGIAYPDAAIKANNGEGKIYMMPGQARDVFVPETILGINAGSEQNEKAYEFLQMVLSEQVQKNDFEDGLPVNSNAFNLQMQDPYSAEDDGIYISSTNRDSGESMELAVKWPSKEFMDEIAGQIKALNTPSVKNEVILKMVIDETVGYFSGSKTLDETVAAFAQKLNLYLSE